MRATLHPISHSVHRQPQPVTILGRVRGDKIKVEGPGFVISVERFRLRDEADRRRLTPAEFDSLPWLLKSEPDPVQQTMEMFAQVERAS